MTVCADDCVGRDGRAQRGSALPDSSVTESSTVDFIGTPTVRSGGGALLGWLRVRTQKHCVCPCAVSCTCSFIVASGSPLHDLSGCDEPSPQPLLLSFPSSLP